MSSAYASGVKFADGDVIKNYRIVKSLGAGAAKRLDPMAQRSFSRNTGARAPEVLGTRRSSRIRWR